MRWWWLGLGALLAAGCAGDKTEEDEESDSAGGDDTAELRPITYPSGNRMLMYTGHGGFPGDGTGKGVYDEVDARWKTAYGWNTDIKDALPEDLSPYRTIFLVGPGYDGDQTFEDTDVQVLNQALARGTRLVIFGEKSMCESSSVAELLTALGVGMSFTGEAADANRLIDADSITSDLQITEGVSSFRFKEPCWVEPGSGVSFGRDDDRNHLGAVERPARGGDVVMIGNFEFLDDGGLLEHGDNGVFSDNLVLVEPGLEPG